MAATKIHEITATVGKAVKYICNPDKTDEKLLVFGYGCEDYSAELEFELTRQQHCSNSKNLARHIIQSFSPGEVTPEQAHAIGKQLADELLRGEYEYILAKKGFYKKHEKELLLYKSSKAELKKIIPGDTLPNVLTLERELESLKKQEAELTEKYNAVLSDVEKLEKAYTQYQTYIGMGIEAKSKTKSGELE